MRPIRRASNGSRSRRTSAGKDIKIQRYQVYPLRAHRRRTFDPVRGDMGSDSARSGVYQLLPLTRRYLRLSERPSRVLPGDGRRLLQQRLRLLVACEAELHLHAVIVNFETPRDHQLVSRHRSDDGDGAQVGSDTYISVTIAYVHSTKGSKTDVHVHDARHELDGLRLECHTSRELHDHGDGDQLPGLFRLQTGSTSPRRAPPQTGPMNGEQGSALVLAVLGDGDPDASRPVVPHDGRHREQDRRERASLRPGALLRRKA